MIPDRVSALLYLLAIGAEDAAGRKVCVGGLWGFRGRAPLASDGKGCLLVAVESDDPTSFVDHVMHAVFFQAAT